MQIRESSDDPLCADHSRALAELRFELVSRNPLALLSTEGRRKSPRI
jgi:hypothetical protein